MRSRLHSLTLFCCGCCGYDGCCCVSAAASHSPAIAQLHQNQPPWLLTLPSHPFHVLCALFLAPKNDAKFSSNEKQAFSAGDRHFSLLLLLRCCCAVVVESENQPTKPPQHPPTLSNNTAHATSLSAALQASQRRLPQQQRPIHPPTTKAHKTKRNVCASMSVCVHVRSAGRACVCVCVMNFNFSLLFLVRPSLLALALPADVVVAVDARFACSFVCSLVRLLGSPSVCTVRWFSWNFAFDLVGCVSCIALTTNAASRQRKTELKEVCGHKTEAHKKGKATKCKKKAKNIGNGNEYVFIHKYSIYSRSTKQKKKYEIKNKKVQCKKIKSKNRRRVAKRQQK